MMANSGIAKKSGWQAKLSMRFSRLQTKTVISSLEHYGPLRVQRPFYPEGEVCHVYLLHPPGGVVGSDELTIDIDTESHARGLITTPGSTKFYRSAGELALVSQHLRVAKEGFLEWFPQENILFPGARVKMQTKIELDSESGFMGWEILCLGRPANQEIFNMGRLDSSIRFYCDDKLLLIERQRISQQRHLDSAAGMRSYPMSALFFAFPCTQQHVDVAREILNEKPSPFPVAITLLDNLLILRALGNSTEKLQQLMIPVWQALRVLLANRIAVLPRIWAT